MSCQLDSRPSSSQGVLYLLTGAAHAVRLVVSLWSLRKYYDGDITVYTTRPGSHRIGELCVADERLRITHEKMSLDDTRRNSSYVAKTVVMASAPYDTNLFLDADTLIVDGISELLDLSDDEECIATQFSNWTTQRRVIRKRLESWRDVQSELFTEDWMNDTIDAAVQPQPAINTGVLAFRKDATILAAWRELTHAGRKKFICDEIAFQLLLNQHPHRILDCRFNCSPTHARNSSDVRIWHFHGDKHVRRESGRQIWMPAYNECVSENVAGIADWSPDADTRLKDHLESEQKLTLGGNELIKVKTKFEKHSGIRTVVTFISKKTRGHLKVTLPTWKRKPDINGSILIVFYSGLCVEELQFIGNEWDGEVRLMELSTAFPDDSSGTFLIDVPHVVTTDHWIKLEPHVLFVDSQPLFPRRAYKTDVFGHRWSFTRPITWLAALDDWFANSRFESLIEPIGGQLNADPDADKIRHRRLTSWASVQRTSFTRQVAEELGTKLPVPSHDTTLWYVAERSTSFEWGACNLEKRGASRIRSLRKLTQRAKLLTDNQTANGVVS